MSGSTLLFILFALELALSFAKGEPGKVSAADLFFCAYMIVLAIEKK